MVAIAASTGGPPALATVLEGLAKLTVPVLIVQHIHPDFVQGLVDWMTRVSPLPVVLAQHGQRCAAAASTSVPAARTCASVGTGRVELVDTPVSAPPPVGRQLFESVARAPARAASGCC